MVGTFSSCPQPGRQGSSTWFALLLFLVQSGTHDTCRWLMVASGRSWLAARPSKYLKGINVEETKY